MLALYVQIVLNLRIRLEKFSTDIFGAQYNSTRPIKKILVTV